MPRRGFPSTTPPLIDLGHQLRHESSVSKIKEEREMQRMNVPDDRIDMHHLIAEILRAGQQQMGNQGWHGWLDG